MHSHHQFMARELTEACIFRIVREKPGTPLIYGDEIQLQHVHTSLFVTLRHSLAPFDRNALEIVLQRNPSAETFFDILPRYSYRAEGDKVCNSDPITLVAAASFLGDQFLHFTKQNYNYDESQEMDVGTHASKRYEVNLYHEPSTWYVRLFRDYAITQESATVKGGDIIRLHHRESQVQLAVENTHSSLFNPASLQSKYRPLEAESPTGSPQENYLPLLRHSSSPFTTHSSSWSLWLIEHENSLSGEAITWHDRIRLKNLCTSTYLCATTVGSEIMWGLTAEKTAHTLFFFHPTQNSNHLEKHTTFLSSSTLDLGTTPRLPPSTNGTIGTTNKHKQYKMNEETTQQPLSQSPTITTTAINNAMRSTTRTITARMDLDSALRCWKGESKQHKQITQTK